MTYTPPTAENIQDRFPALANADEYLLDTLIAEAMTYVDESWEERDYKPAIQYLVAHWYVRGGGNTGAGGGATQGLLASESFGPMSRSFFLGNPGTTSTEEADLNSTDYGRHFISLRRRNFTGPIVA